jgi:hypothetical protein
MTMAVAEPSMSVVPTRLAPQRDVVWAAHHLGNLGQFDAARGLKLTKVYSPMGRGGWTLVGSMPPAVCRPRYQGDRGRCA